ncbi:hypothetical protein [Croceitalea dokdonensis]|uniref:hypothetical protein n=1 Tax=Croceitalea dokdonensis TaxID=346188 RepID=UPI0012FAE0A8|nr:hypothetical protein [Croceitalea dokdonensis]
MSEADRIALITITETPLKLKTLNGAGRKLFSKDDRLYVKDFNNEKFTITIANQNATNDIDYGIVRNNENIY